MFNTILYLGIKYIHVLNGFLEQVHNYWECAGKLNSGIQAEGRLRDRLASKASVPLLPHMDLLLLLLHARDTFFGRQGNLFRRFCVSHLGLVKSCNSLD